MTYADGEYRADIELPLLTESNISNVKLNDNGNIRTCADYNRRGNEAEIYTANGRPLFVAQ